LRERGDAHPLRRPSWGDWSYHVTNLYWRNDQIWGCNLIQQDHDGLFYRVCDFLPLEPLAPRLIHPSHESSSSSISFSSFILSEWNICWRGCGKLKFSFVENNVIVWIGLVVAFLCDTVCLWHCVKDETVKRRRGNNIKHLFVPICFDPMPLLILWF